MVEYGASQSSLQVRPVQPDSRGVLDLEHALNDGVESLGGHLTTKVYIERDKGTFARLLRLIVSANSAKGQAINLETSEELARLIPVLCTYFSRDELVNLVGEETSEKFLDMYRTEMLQNLFLESELQKVLCAFNKAAIPLLLFKGPTLAYTIYPRSHLRTYHDFDALIKPDDVSRAHELLKQMGYSFYNEYRADAVDEQRTGYNYSLGSPDIPFSVLIELHTAPHSSEIGMLFDREALWKNAIAITILGQSAVTMNTVDHLLYLCWHYRFHGFTRLLWLYDLVMILRANSNSLDWAALIRTARHQCMATTLFYCLSWCKDLFGVAIPEKVFEQLRPPLLSRLIVERIALPDVARGLSVTDYQERRILARRAMVDNNIGLLKAGLRMLFPSPIALQKRYMDHSPLPLRLFFLFYLLHPWVTLAKGIRNLLRRKKNVQDRGEI
jgi:Uncharacterised nucleotidyltransferase